MRHEYILAPKIAFYRFENETENTKKKNIIRMHVDYWEIIYLDTFLLLLLWLLFPNNLDGHLFSKHFSMLIVCVAVAVISCWLIECNL